MFNGSGEVGVEGADCAVSVGWAVKWDWGGSQPAYCRMGRAEKTGGEGGVFRESTLNRTDQPWCLLVGNKCRTENPPNEACIIQYLLWLESCLSHTVLPGKMKTSDCSLWLAVSLSMCVIVAVGEHSGKAALFCGHTVSPREGCTLSTVDGPDCRQRPGAECFTSVNKQCWSLQSVTAMSEEWS